MREVAAGARARYVSGIHATQRHYGKATLLPLLQTTWGTSVPSHSFLVRSVTPSSRADRLPGLRPQSCAQASSIPDHATSAVSSASSSANDTAARGQRCGPELLGSPSAHPPPVPPALRPGINSTLTAKTTTTALRSALAHALAATVALTAAIWAPLGAPPASAAGLPSLPAALVTALSRSTAAGAVPSLEAPPLGPTGQGLPASPASPGPASSSGQAGVAPAGTAAQPAIRFTGPELLDALPPLPSDFPPLPELQLPSYTTTKLRNGLRVFLLRDDEVPLVRATLLMRGGQYGSPPDKVGLATLAAYVQRAGGSTAHPAPSLDTRLEELAASIELGAGPQAVSADMQCLAEDAEEVLQLLAEIVRSPTLPADKLALYQSQIYNALEHQNDSPGAIARRKISKLMYGADSIYARSPTKDGVASITPADLAAYVAAWERPDAAVLGVVGAFEPRQMMALVQREFGDWAPAPGQPVEPPAVPRGAPPAVPPVVQQAAAASAAAAGGEAGPGAGSGQSSGATAQVAVVAAARAGSAATAAGSLSGSGPRRPVVYLVDRPGLTQANVVVAEPGISLSDPDVFALDVLSGVFNSFGGQLFDTLRSREGLAYSVSGSWDSPADHPGLFVAGGQTSLPGDFLRSLRQLLARAASEAPSEAELAAAKAETLNSFAFNFASTSSQLQRILVYDLLGLPQNFLFKYISGIEAVQRGDVERAAAAHLHPERQAVVVVADRELAGPSLEAAGFEVLPLKLDDAAPL